jgi:hypothetical protein
MAGMTVEVTGTDRFYRNLQTVISQSKRDAMDVAHTHFKGVVKNALSITPPLGGKNPSLATNAKGDKTGAIAWKDGLEAGRAAINSDLGKAFRPTPGKKSAEDMLAWYLSVRNAKSKRITRNFKKPATPAEIQRIRKALQGQQGTVLSGWNKVCSYFGITLKEWVSRWGDRNSIFRVERSENRYFLYAGNVTNHRNANNIQRRLDIAFKMQANNMQRMIDRIITKKAKERGL